MLYVGRLVWLYVIIHGEIGPFLLLGWDIHWRRQSLCFLCRSICVLTPLVFVLFIVSLCNLVLTSAKHVLFFEARGIPQQLWFTLLFDDAVACATCELWIAAPLISLIILCVKVNLTEVLWEDDARGNIVSSFLSVMISFWYLGSVIVQDDDFSNAVLCLLVVVNPSAVIKSCRHESCSISFTQGTLLWLVPIYLWSFTCM